MSYYGGTVTVAGRDLITSLLAGETIELTRIEVGSGAVPDGVELIDMTDLITPVAAGSSTLPSVENNILSLTVEYRNDMDGGLQSGFWLREFGIYAKTDLRDEVLLYYATLGDSPQPVSAYDGSRVDIRRYPVTIALALDAEVQVTYNPGAFMTAADIQDVVNNVSQTAEKIAKQASRAKLETVTIPFGEWVEDTEEFAGMYHADVSNEDATENVVVVSGGMIDTVSQNTASECQLCQYVQTFEGKIRFYAKKAAVYDITVTLILMNGSTSGSTETGEYTLPIASAYTLGGVKVGDGLNVSSTGVLSVDTTTLTTELAATDEEVDEALEDALGG